MRTLIGLLLGLVLFLLGVPVLQSIVENVGYYHPFTYEQAVLAMLLVRTCIIAVQLSGRKPPPRE